MVGSKWLNAVILLAASLPATARAEPHPFAPISHAQCNETWPHDKKVVNYIFTDENFRDPVLRPLADETYADTYLQFVVFCGFGDPGSDDYNKNLALALAQCRSGQRPNEAWDRLGASPYFKFQFNNEIDCTNGVEKVASAFGFDESHMSGADSVVEEMQRVIDEIEKNAEQGAQQAMFVAAVFFFDLDNRKQQGSAPDSVQRGLYWFNRLAASGGEEMIHNYLLSKERQYGIGWTESSADFRYRDILNIYQILAQYGYPPAHILEAQRSIYFSTRARVDEDRERILNEAVVHLQKAKKNASNDQLVAIRSLEEKVADASRSTDWSTIILGLLAIAATVSDGRDEAVDPMDSFTFDPCAGMKDLVMLDDSFAGPVAIGGCSPY